MLIQARARVLAARREVGSMQQQHVRDRHEEEESARQAAAVRIQGSWRNRQVKEESARQAAAARIQGSWRIRQAQARRLPAAAHIVTAIAPPS